MWGLSVALPLLLMMMIASPSPVSACKYTEADVDTDTRDAAVEFALQAINANLQTSQPLQLRSVVGELQAKECIAKVTETTYSENQVRFLDPFTYKVVEITARTPHRTTSEVAVDTGIEGVLTVVPTPNLVECAYSKTENSFLRGFAGQDKTHWRTLVAAQVRCDQLGEDDCGGVTQHADYFEVRTSRSPEASSSGEDSWVKGECQAVQLEQDTVRGETAAAVTIRFSVNWDKQGNRALTHFSLPNADSEDMTALGLPYLNDNASADAADGNDDGEQPPHLDIGCVNIWNYNYWEERLPVLKAELDRMAPDVIGAQEVRARKIAPDSYGYRWQHADMWTMFPGYQFTYVPAMGFSESDDEYVHEGLAIFSKYPIVASDHLRLSQNLEDGNDFHSRICLRALVQTPLGLVNFFTTHMSLSHEAQARTLPEIGEWANSFAEPAVLVGDFNAELKEDDNPLTETYGFHDAWGSLHGFENTPESWTFNSWEPKSRIDFVFLNGLVASEVTVEGSIGVNGNRYLEPRGGVKDMKQTLYPSDHMFLKARLVKGEYVPRKKEEDDEQKEEDQQEQKEEDQQEQQQDHDEL